MIVPEDWYGKVLTRTKAYLEARRDHESAVHYFLSHRCDQLFLRLFLKESPEFHASLQVHSYFYAVSDIDVIVRLHAVGLLPEAERQRHVAAIREYAAETPDSGILRRNVRSLFTKAEFDEAIEYIRSNLIDDLKANISNWCDNKRSDDDPENYFSEFKSALREFREEFEQRDDDVAIGLIDRGLELTDKAITHMYEDMPPEPDDDRGEYGSSRSGDDISRLDRSVFDDVDA